MDEKNFIREQIKEKPVNKKKVLEKVGVSLICGLAFAIIASLGIAFLEPRFSALFSKSKTGQVSEFEGEGIEDSETESEENTESPSVDYVVTVEDYQKIQKELYNIGLRANKSIVTVTGVSSNTDWFNNTYENTNNGSGVIISTSGNQILILTERKNIASAEKISVSFVDETSAEANLVSYDGNTGLAVISVDKTNVDGITYNRIGEATFGSSIAVTSGEMVIALGSPLGTNYSILVGNITSRNNVINTTDCNYNIFTTDIVASKGGTGVLINTQGQIVGIVMQDYSNSMDEGTLTAVAIGDLENVIELLTSGKGVPYLGVEMTSVTEKIASDYDIPKGIFVKEVEMDSPAMVGGLQPGDVITSFDGKEMRIASDLTDKLMQDEVEKTVEVKVKRQSGNDYNEVKLQVVLGRK